MKSLPKSQPKDIIDSNGKGEISIYESGNVDAETFAHGVKKLKAAFPRLAQNWYDLLDEMIDESNFNAKKFRDAVYNLIKTCPYPEPTIANFLNYDKKVKVFNFKESIDYGQKYLVAVDFGYGKPRWVTEEDQEKYKFDLWGSKK